MSDLRARIADALQEHGIECKVCHQEWTPDEINSDGVCDYCWDAHGEDWLGE